MSNKGDGQQNSSQSIQCSFCGKNQNQVHKLIAGPSVYICDECVRLCDDIIKEEGIDSVAVAGSFTLPKPKEIHRILDEYVVGRSEERRVG